MIALSIFTVVSCILFLLEGEVEDRQGEGRTSRPSRITDVELESMSDEQLVALYGEARVYAARKRGRARKNAHVEEV